jgi:L-alanine-DL-glutamate epimerase-like enolase superfamily enzyme
MIHIASGIGNTAGPMMEALSGIDTALWDLKGRVHGLPVYKILGGPHFEKIFCYGTPVMLFDDPKDTQSRAQELVDLGFKAIKLKMGRTIDIDLKHIDAVRRQVGKDIQLLIDMNCGYEGRTDEAIAFAKELIPYDIFWFEEPVSPENIEAYKKIRKSTDLLFATGENDFTLTQFKRIIDSGVIDVVMPNSGRAGGITGIKKIASYAEKKGVKLSPHGVGSGVSILASLHAMQSCTNSLIFEYNQFLNPLRLGIMRNDINFNDSQIILNSDPGLGVEVNWETIAKYLDGKWEQ